MDPRPRPEVPLELDVLLEHRNFLQALVRQLIADEQGVEDVLQETWLKALERPPSSLDSLKAWLARVARNAALNRLRGQQRSNDRERIAARTERIETTALDTAQKLERQQRVLAAVLHLREPRRTAIHMRYFEDKDPSEIASILNVSVNTVNDRLRRGRRELRAELERELGTRLMGLYLLPLAGLSKSAGVALQAQLAAAAAAGATASAALSPTLLGGLLMSKKILIAATIALGATGVWWTLSGPRAATADGLIRPTVTALTERPTPTDEGMQQAATAEPTPVNSEPQRVAVSAPLTVDGVVEDRNDQRLADVEVSLKLWHGFEAEGEAALTTTASSNAEGRFAWSLPRPDGTFVVHASVSDPEFVGYGSEALAVGGADPDTLFVRAHPLDMSITGHVRDGDGLPIAGATVRASRSTTTDTDGAYVLPAASQSPGMIYASAPGFASKREIMEVVPAGGGRLDFELQREFRVFGRIVDEQGQPVEGVAVTTFYTAGMENIARTDASGQYELGGLDPARENHSLYARKDGYIEASEKLTMPPDLLFEQDLVMRLGTRVEGRVLDDDGQGLAGAALYIGFSPNAYDRIDTVSGDEGRFVFPHVKPGKQTIATHLEGFAPDRREFELVDGQVCHDGLEIVMHQGRTLEGRVLDSERDPVVGVRVSPRYKGDWIELRGETDEEGHFELDNLPPSEVELSFYRPGFVRHRLPIQDGELEPLEVNLERSGKLAGRVVNGYTGAPVTDFTVRLMQAECPDGPTDGSSMAATWVREGHSFSSAEGAWDTGDEILGPGDYLKVEITAPGYGPGFEDCVLVELDPDAEAHVVQLFAGAKVEGRVFDRATGQPLAGAVVRRSLTRVINPREPHDVQLVRTDANGAFVLSDVPPGSISLLVEHANWEREFRDGPFEVNATGLAPYREIAIGAGASISGILRDADGSPLAGARVEIEGEGRQDVGDKHDATYTDADGRFRFDGISDGAYVVARARGERLIADFRVIVFVQNGTSHEVDLAPDRGSATLSGTLDVDGSDELPDLPVWIGEFPASPADVSGPIPSFGAVAVGGSFRLEGLPSGSFKVFVQHQDEATGTSYVGAADVEVSAGSDSRVTVPVAVRR